MHVASVPEDIHPPLQPDFVPCDPITQSHTLGYQAQPLHIQSSIDEIELIIERHD